MMENVFLRLLNMSLTAAVLVVVVLLLRLVFHKAPRWIHCLLWALVAVRLLCPFAIESDLSLMPSAPVMTVPDSLTPSDPVVTPNTPSVDVIDPDAPATDLPPQTNVGGTVTPPVAPTLPDSSVAAPGDSVDPWQVALTVATYAWLLGMLAMLTYAVATTLRLRLQVREAVRVQGNLWQCDHLRSPFILGVLRPRIYLPSHLDSTAQDGVIAHEKAHLRRLDHLWKPLGFLLLAVHWFNPVLWAAYIFLCRDIEAACDEQVVRHMTAADRKVYSEALLSCSAPRRLVSACPLAFGETSVKSRIQSVLSYKKPTIWIVVAALLVSTIAGVCLLTDRPVAEQEPDELPTTTTTTTQTSTTTTASDAAVVTTTSTTDSEASTTDRTTAPSTTATKPTTTTTTAKPTTTTTAPTSPATPAVKTAAVGDTHVAGGYGLWKDEIVNEVYGERPEGSELRVRVIRSYAELDAFLDAYAVNDRYLKRADFYRFDAAWFEENALIMTYYVYGGCPVYPTVASYVCSEDGTTLTVGVDVYLPSMLNDAMGCWHLFSGIKKSDLECVTKVTAYVRAEMPKHNYVAMFTEPTRNPQSAVEEWRTWIPYEESREFRQWVGSGLFEDGTRSCEYIAVINMGGHNYYVAKDFKTIQRDDGKLYWMTENGANSIKRLIAVADQNRGLYEY